MTTIDPQKYYRLPWSLTDNAISWLEVTTSCNLACEGCYRDTRSAEGHKSLAEIEADLDVFAQNRNSDAISIAGGDPLVHPRIVDIVKMIKARRWKPIINTNGLALTTPLLEQLKAAGIFGFTFHIDTSQRRKDAKGARREVDFNPLRERLARMLADVGGVACSLNQTVTDDTLDQIPDVVAWARGLPEIIHTVVFILYREPDLLGDEFDYFANGKQIPVARAYKNPNDWGGTKKVTAADVVAKIREVEPDYEPCAYLGGSVNPKSVKWLLGTRIATRERGFGWVSPRYMEVVQSAHHLVTGNFMAYTSPAVLSMGGAASFAFGLFDRQMRGIAGNIAKNALRHPAQALSRAWAQSFLIIQPIDVLPDGRQDMCDGCPDMTVYKGKLYYSCRLEEVKTYGAFVTAAPRARDAGPMPPKG